MATARIAVCDYGVGNVRSVERAVLAAGGQPRLTRDRDEIDAADGLILPGVGAFGAAVDALEQTGLGTVVADFAASGRPLLGVCLGFQVLFETSDESGGRRGLGLLPGHIERLGPERGKVPHMGWNALAVVRPSRLLDGLHGGDRCYFVHSYAARADDGIVVATTDYGGPVVAVCERDNVLATQFHPEKSGRAGLRIYANFVRISSAAGVPR